VCIVVCISLAEGRRLIVRICLSTRGVVAWWPQAVIRGLIQKQLGTLVDVIDERPFLIHQSLRDFLLKTELWQTSPVMSNIQPPELLLAHSCMSYLSFRDFGVDYQPVNNRSLNLEEYPLFDYASKFWYSHINTPTEGQKYLTILENILKPPNSDIWVKRHRNLSQRKFPPTLCNIAIAYDIGWFANMLLNKLSDSFIDTFDKSCLFQAAQSSPGVFKELLMHPEIKSIKATEEVVKAVAGNYESGAEIMELLLQERGSEFTITEIMPGVVGPGTKIANKNLNIQVKCRRV
jgi:hypothetical protein